MDAFRQFFPSSTSNPVLLLSAEDLAGLLAPRICFEALRQAYRDLADDLESVPKALGFLSGAGTYHIKAGVYPKARDVFAAKLNANFPENFKGGLPTIQGLVLLSDARRGTPLAVMDSGELTARRTAAAAALAAHFGARPSSRTVAFVGCGRQAGHVLQAIARILPLERGFAFDPDASKAKAFAETFRGKAIPAVEIAKDVSTATLEADVIVTCTTSTRPVLLAGQVRAGTFIAAIGADNPGKQEIDPELFRGSAVVVDDRAQCAASGDLHHALKAGAFAEQDVRADLCELASENAEARKSDREIVLFDSTGTGLQDVAAARAAYHAALRVNARA